MNRILLAQKGTLRTDETEADYDKYKADGCLNDGQVLLDAEAKITFKYWKIVTNKFPYDKITALHDLLVPLRMTDGRDFTQEEIDELLELRETYINDNYQFIFEAMNNSKTVPEHFHLHLIITK